MASPHRSAAAPIAGWTAARVATIALGYLLLAGGTVLLVLPGPGIPLMLAGLAVIGRQQHWARRAGTSLRRRVGRLVDRATGARRVH